MSAREEAARRLGSADSGQGLIFVFESFTQRYLHPAQFITASCPLSTREARVLRTVLILSEKLPGRFVPYPTLSVCSIAPEEECRRLVEDWDGTTIIVGYRG